MKEWNLTALAGLLAVAILIDGCMPTNSKNAPNSSGTVPKEQARFAICENYCGLVDGLARPVTQRIFETVEEIGGSVILYGHQGRVGAVDRDGHTLIPATHAILRLFSNDTVLAIDGDGDAGSWLVNNVSTTWTLYSDKGKVLFSRNKMERDPRAPISRSDNGLIYIRDACDEGQTLCGVSVLTTGSHSIAARFDDMTIPPIVGVIGANGLRYGVIDSNAKFVIQPNFKRIQTYDPVNGLAIVETDKGSAVVDSSGRILTDAGAYKSLYLPGRNQPFIEAYRGHNICADVIRKSGSRVPFPTEPCLSSQNSAERLGYVEVQERGGLRRSGLASLTGQIRVPAIYRSLTPIDEKFLSFSSADDKYQGVVTVDGKVVLPARYRLIRGKTETSSLRGVFIAKTDEGFGLIDASGAWHIPPQYTDANILDSKLLWLEVSPDNYRLAHPDGTLLPLESADKPSLADWQNPDSGLFKVSVKDTDTVTQTRRYGLVDNSGRIVIPTIFSDIRPANDGLWEVRVWNKEANDALVGLYDSSGNQLVAPRFWSIQLPFVAGAAVATNLAHQTVLIDTHGHELTSFAKLFPELVERNNESDAVTRLLDVCYVNDPTAEPQEPMTRNVGLVRLCGNRDLRKRSCEVEFAYYAAQGEDCHPEQILRLRAGYTSSLANATDDTGVGAAIERFENSITQTARFCDKRISPLPQGKQISLQLQRQLIRSIRETDHLTDKDPNNLGTFAFSALQMAGRPAVFVSYYLDRNESHWLFNRERSGRWRLTFEGEGNLQIVNTSALSMPILVNSQMNSWDGGSTVFYDFDRKGYRAILNCDYLFANEGEKALRACHPVNELSSGS
ncbi:WG repeat-containing protein [Paraburkholderia sediminicola]|uniref:WG repeat-containing protein n=1 Tax=Paraburkholderia sediminicola TaxID=458836 RepID=UPI0038B8B3EC